jgi:hypothetical protein
LRFNRGLETIDRTTFRRRATPGIGRDVRRLGRVAFFRCAVQWVRRQEKFHALDVPGWCAIAHIHVTATNPLCAGRHADLVGAAIIANGCPNGVRSMEEIVARLGRVVATGVAYAVVNGIVPVLIVIGVCSVPTAVVRLERVMRPTNAGIRACNDDSFPLESKRPHVRRMRVINSGLDRRRSSGTAGLQRRLLDWTRLRKVIVDRGIALDARHISASRERIGNLSSAFHQDGVNDIERLGLNLVFAQPLQDWPLSVLRLFQQGLINKAALLVLGWQIGGRAEIRLIC